MKTASQQTQSPTNIFWPHFKIWMGSQNSTGIGWVSPAQEKEAQQINRGKKSDAMTETEVNFKEATNNIQREMA